MATGRGHTSQTTNRCTIKDHHNLHSIRIQYDQISDRMGFLSASIRICPTHHMACLTITLLLIDIHLVKDQHSTPIHTARSL